MMKRDRVENIDHAVARNDLMYLKTLCIERYW